MNVYDFDKTIFYPDSSFCFFFYCLRHYPRAVLRRSGEIVRFALRYARRAVSTKELKEKLFAFLCDLPVKRFREAFPDGQIDAFYSDSFSDAPLARIARQAWLVKKETLSPWPLDAEGKRKDRD